MSSSSVFIVKFEQVNADWEIAEVLSDLLESFHEKLNQWS